MTKYHVEMKNIKGLPQLSVSFDFSSGNIAVVTGRNGAGKTTLVNAFKLINDARVFEKTSSLKSIGPGSAISFRLNNHEPFTFSYDPKLKALDTRQKLPPRDAFRSELPIPYGARFQQFSLVAKYDSEIRANIASSKYEDALIIREFLRNVYPDSNGLDNLKTTQINRYQFYFVLRPNDYYIREDHFSSGEFFLIQLYRLITSGAELIIIDELDVSLDASAQVHLFSAIQPLLETNRSNLVVVSHSLAFMKTVRSDGLYYLELEDGKSSLKQRSYGYIKSDLYGFKGRERWIITEDETLVGFIKHVIRVSGIAPFFNYEIIAVGGQPQIDAIASRNDRHEIFGPSSDVIIIIDRDISNQLNYRGKTKVHTSPVDDIELYIWENRERNLSNVNVPKFTPAKRDKDTAKTYWKKVINSGQRTREDLYQIIVDENTAETERLVSVFKSHLCLSDQDGN